MGLSALRPSGLETMSLNLFKTTVAVASISQSQMQMIQTLVRAFTFFGRTPINYLTALDFEGPFCCDSEVHGSAHSLDFWLPNASHNALAPVPGSDLDLDSDSDSDSDMDIDSGLIFVGSQRPLPQVSRMVYRPMAERKDLEVLVNSWRVKVHSEDIGASFFPMNDILPASLIPKLVRLPSGSSELSTPANITKFVGRSEEWMCIYAHSLCTLIAEFDAAVAASKVKPVRKPRVQKPQDIYMGVLKAPKQNTKGKGRVPASTPAPSASTSTPIASTSQTASTPAPSTLIPTPIPSTSQKRALPTSPQQKTRKRAKREPLGEIPLNYRLN